MAEPSLRDVHRSGDRVVATTQYISGRNRRFESGGKAQISNQDLHLGFELDLEKGIYTAFPANRFSSPTWSRPIRTKPLKRSGSTIHYHFETIDTGERRECFGYTTRHVITRTSSTRDSQPFGESEDDGWYIDPPAAWLVLNPPPSPGTFYHLGSCTDEIDDCKVTQVGERETGFPILFKRTSKSFHRVARRMATFEHFYEDEVSDFSEAPLERSLFVPPPNFKRMAWLALDGVRYRFSYRLRHRWEFFKASLTLSCRIANYLR
ncbi:MAG: hypothetical protein ACRD4O_12745 [Bryobacteraceae bacterium]